MTARRVINWVVSLSAGLISTVVIIQLFNTTLDKFTLGNAIMVFLSIAAIVFIWLDFILRTDYLRN
ncbi:MAG: hypothetical protein P1P76_02590 [Anaerolineales bacterium]|nr:hypothetical protein [Anaerolineales bacterium]